MFELLIGISTLIIGWILGILSNIVSEKLHRNSSKTDIINGMKTELNTLQMHLATVSLKSFCILDEFDKEFFNWVKPHYLKSFNSTQIIFTKSQLSAMPNLEELDDDQLFLLMKTAFISSPTEPKAQVFTFQNIIIPFVDSKINEIALLDQEVQNELMILKRDINFLNGDISRIWFYYSKTFDAQSENNMLIINANIQNLYGQIGTRSKHVVDCISRIFEALK